MNSFFEGIGFYVRLIVMLFTWLAVAVFVNPQLASLMGLFVIGLWLFVFMPIGLSKEINWQKRQQHIMQAALNASQSNDDIAGLIANQKREINNPLVIVSQQGQALDVYRELPQLPALEERSHSSFFTRACALLVAGIIMFFGAENDTFMHRYLESRGMLTKIPINIKSVNVPDAFRDVFLFDQSELEQAARMTISRLPACKAILSASISPQQQFVTVDEQKSDFEDGKYVYNFTCLPANNLQEPPFLTWITRDELSPGRISTILKLIRKRANEQMGLSRCTADINKKLAHLNKSVQAPTLNKKTSIFLRHDEAASPYTGSLYLVYNALITDHSGSDGIVAVSCWVDGVGRAQARLIR